MQTENLSLPSIIDIATKKRQPRDTSHEKALRIGDLLQFSQVTPSGDLLLTSRKKTELPPSALDDEGSLNHRIPSRIIISPSGRQILSTNRNLLQDLFEGRLAGTEFPDNNYLKRGAHSSVLRMLINTSDGLDTVAVKIHDEGQASYLRCNDFGEYPPQHDAVSGIDTFLMLRAIKEFSRDSRVTAPEPLFATLGLCVLEYVNGVSLDKSQVPHFVKSEIKNSFTLASRGGYFNYGYSPDTSISIGPLIFHRKFALDRSGNGNVLLKEDGTYSVIDPIIGNGKS